MRKAFVFLLAVVLLQPWPLLANSETPPMPRPMLHIAAAYTPDALAYYDMLKRIHNNFSRGSSLLPRETIALAQLGKPPIGTASGAGGLGSGVVDAVGSYGVKGDLNVAFDATVTNASSTVTIAAGDVQFTASDVGKMCMATSGGGPANLHITGVLALSSTSCTISTFVSGTQITISTTGNASATGTNNNIFIWATNNTTTMTNAWNAAMNPSKLAPCKTLVLPATPFLVAGNFGSNSQTCKLTITGGGNEGPTIFGWGQLNSLMVVHSSFNYTTQCSPGSTCFFGGIGVGMQNFGIWGGEYGNISGASSKCGLSINTDNHIVNVQLLGWGPSASSGFTGLCTLNGGSAAQQYGIIVDGAGQICATISVNGIPISNSWFGDCNTSNMTVNANIRFPSSNNTYGPVANNANSVNVLGTMFSSGDSTFITGTQNNAGFRVATGGTLFANNLYADASGNTTGVALWVNGGTAYIGQSQFKGGATGNDVLLDTSGKYFNFGGVSFLQARSSGILLVTGNVVLSAGWGTTASVSAPVGDKQAFRFTATSSGTGQGANPTMTVTYPNAFITAPIYNCKQVGGTGTLTTVSGEGGATTTSVALTFNGTPVAASTYIFSCVEAASIP